jgi:cytidine deaminase
MYHPATIARDTLAKHAHFKVGVYLETNLIPISRGNVQFGGSERLTLCAETLALAEAKSCGAKPTHLFMSTDSNEVVFPCGVCLQYASEYPDLKVTIYNRDGSKKETKTINELLPYRYERPTK